jgi:monomeric isocitrate dehydrogenase
VNELDNRGSHFYLALYWAEAIATQTQTHYALGIAEFCRFADQLKADDEVHDRHSKMYGPGKSGSDLGLLPS